MTEKPAILVLGDEIQRWAEQWRGSGPADSPAAIAEGVALCDAVVGRATPLLDGPNPRPLNPEHLLLLRAFLGTWTTGAWRARKRFGIGGESPTLAAAVERAWKTVQALAAAEAAVRASRPPEPAREFMTQQEVRDAIRLRRSMDG